jgi:hypothetical protein
VVGAGVAAFNGYAIVAAVVLLVLWAVVWLCKLGDEALDSIETRAAQRQLDDLNLQWAQLGLSSSLRSDAMHRGHKVYERVQHSLIGNVERAID